MAGRVQNDPFAAAPPLDYAPTPDGLELPAGANFGGVSGVAFNSKDHLFVFHRGPGALMEFDANGKFVRALGDGLFVRPHGLRIDADDCIWLTDVGAHFAAKLDPAGRIAMILGVKGNGGEWHQFGHLRLLSEPNEVATGPDGSLYIPQGHGKAENCILKFDQNGNFLAAWGRTGQGAGEFDIPHSIVFDRAGLLHVADRSNGRIQVFNQDGQLQRTHPLPGTPCGLHMGPDQTLWLAHGHKGLLAKLDTRGNVLAVTGGQGKAPGHFGEAHYLAMNSRGDIVIGDPLNWRVQRFVHR